MCGFSRGFGLALALALLCLGPQTAHAQAGPLSYWAPSLPIGFGAGLTEGQGSNTYGNFPSFDGRDGDGGFHYKFSNGFFVSGGSSQAFSLNGLGQAGAFGNFSTNSVQFGYNFQNSPLKVFGGFDTLKYDTGFGPGSPFAAFDSNSSQTAGFGGYAGVEFKPASNVSLSLGVGYQQSGDANSYVLPGASPFAPRR
jgi:opacity protein-like surface antigen